MNVLMIEDASAAAAKTAAALRTAGYEVRTCRDSVDGFACQALLGGKCTLDTVLVDAAVAVREPPLDEGYGGGTSGFVSTYGSNRSEVPSLGDEGIVCALRRHIPLVMVCDTGDPFGGPFDQWIAAGCVHDEVAETIEQIVNSPADDYSSVATESVRSALAAYGAGGTGGTATVYRRSGRLEARVSVTPGTAPHVAEECRVKVLSALHQFDPWIARVDVT